MLHGDDTLRVYLGQGWYCGRFTCDNKTQIYGERPAVSWVLELELMDGSRQFLCSDDDSVHAVPSPYDYAGLYDGEIFFAEGASHPESQELFPPGSLQRAAAGSFYACRDHGTLQGRDACFK